MADPRQARAGASGYSVRLGAKDPRLRSNQGGQVGDQDLDQKTLGRDGAGRTRFTGFDQIAPLASGATLADVVARLNLIVQKGKGM